MHTPTPVFGDANPLDAVQNVSSFNSMLPSDRLFQLQRESNNEETTRVQRSTISGMTFDIALQDAREALSGIFGDLYDSSERKSIRDILFHKDRLRGLGLLLIFVGAIGFVLEAISGS